MRVALSTSTPGPRPAPGSAPNTSCRPSVEQRRLVVVDGVEPAQHRPRPAARRSSRRARGPGPCRPRRPSPRCRRRAGREVLWRRARSPAPRTCSRSRRPPGRTAGRRPRASRWPEVTAAVLGGELARRRPSWGRPGRGRRAARLEQAGGVPPAHRRCSSRPRRNWLTTAPVARRHEQLDPALPAVGGEHGAVAAGVHDAGAEPRSRVVTPVQETRSSTSVLLLRPLPGVARTPVPAGSSTRELSRGDPQLLGGAGRDVDRTSGSPSSRSAVSSAVARPTDQSRSEKPP